MELLLRRDCPHRAGTHGSGSCLSVETPLKWWSNSSMIGAYGEMNISTRPARVFSVYTALLVFSSIAWLWSSPASATSIFASTNLNSGTSPEPTGDDQDDDFVSSDTGGVVTANAATNTGFGSTATIWDATAFATADAASRSVGVGIAMSLTDFDESIIGQFNHFASSNYDETFVFDASATDPFFLSPVFDLDGTLQATPDVPARILLTMEVFAPSGYRLETLFSATAPSDGSTMTVGEPIVATPFDAVDGDSIRVRFTLSALIENFSVSSLSAGDYLSSIDFANTLTFQGMAVWEDAAMTSPVTAGVSFTSPSGSLPVVDPASVPEPALLLLIGSGLMLIGFVRHRRPSTSSVSPIAHASGRVAPGPAIDMALA